MYDRYPFSAQLPLPLYRLDLGNEISADLHQQITLASVCEVGTAIIVVSSTGHALPPNEVLKIAKQHGAKVILFTSTKNSPLAQQADAILMATCPELIVHNLTMT